VSFIAFHDIPGTVEFDRTFGRSALRPYNLFEAQKNPQPKQPAAGYLHERDSAPGSTSRRPDNSREMKSHLRDYKAACAMRQTRSTGDNALGTAFAA
jgi:hypothetical protein